MYTWSKRNHINTTTLALGTLIACTGGNTSRTLSTKRMVSGGKRVKTLDLVKQQALQLIIFMTVTTLAVCS